MYMVTIEKIVSVVYDKELVNNRQHLLFIFSIMNRIRRHQGLTVRQGARTLEILRFVKEKIIAHFPEAEETLNNPVWENPLVEIKKTRILKIEQGKIVLEVSHTDPTIRQIMLENQDKFEGQLVPASRTGSSFSLSLTERNILNAVRLLKRYNVEMSEEIVALYQEINELVNSNTKWFSYDELDPESGLIKALSSEIDRTNDTHVFDRQLRYQYKVRSRTLPLDTLTNKIAARKNPTVFIDSKKITFPELFASMRELRRLPMLVIVDEYNPAKSTEFLKGLVDELTSFPDLTVGTYIRFDNDAGVGEQFNRLVKDHGLNAKLQADTSIAIISNSHLPKFMVGSEWYPRSVISINNRFKHSKSYIYCNSVDLIAYYNTAAPLGIGLENELL
mgnify:CR=1 FL=1